MPLLNLRARARRRGSSTSTDRRPRRASGAATARCGSARPSARRRSSARALVAEHWPLLAQAVRHVGHAATRSRGTVGGSVVHADPRAAAARSRWPRSTPAASTSRRCGPLDSMPASADGSRCRRCRRARGPRSPSTRAPAAYFADAGAAVVLAPGHAAVALLGTGRVADAEAALLDGASARGGRRAGRRRPSRRPPPGARRRAHPPRARGGGARVKLRINGASYEAEVEPRTLLSDFIRDQGLTGTKVGCEHGVCGACTVQLDGEPVRSCLTLAVQADGCDVAHDRGARARPLQAAFHEHHALQCGFCTAGILMTLDAYLREHPDPTEDEVKRGAGRQPVPLHGLPPDRRSGARTDEAALARTTARSCCSRCPRSARSPPSRCTCSSTRRSSATSARRSSPRWRSPRRCSRPRSRSSTSSPTAPPRRSRACTARAATHDAAALGSQALWLALGDRAAAARAARG